MSRRARNALIGGATAAVVAAVVLPIVFTGHHGGDAAQGRTFTVPPMTFSVHTAITIPLDGGGDPGCAPARDALSTVTDVFGSDTNNPSAAVADAQKAIEQADEAGAFAQSPELKSAVAAMKVHLTALHDSAQANDVGSEASVLMSMQSDMNAVLGACTS